MRSEPIIGVDARPLCHPGTGLYRYTLELLSRMSSMGGQWHLYSPRDYDRSVLAGPNVHHRSAPWATVLGGNQSSQLLFPYWLKKDRVEVFWGTRHDLPLLMSSDIRAVLTVHDLAWMSHGNTMPLARRLSQRVLLPGSLRRAEAITCVSSFTACEVQAHFPDTTDKLTVIHNASSLGLPTKAEYSQQQESDYFLFVGTMEPRKNLPGLLQAYRHHLDHSQKPKRLKLVGGLGWGGIHPDQLITDNDLGTHVDHVGQCGDEELASLYAGAYALLMPSLYEGYGLPVIEALSFGVPALVSENSAMSEVAAGAGITVNPLSIDSMAAAMTRLTDEPALYERLCEASVPRAGDFSWDGAASHLYSLIHP
jgi:glycosyltransferase involved in cell wall biosynthesis